MVALAFAVVDAVFSAVNVGLYADSHGPWNLAAAVFCGLLFFLQIEFWKRTDA